MQKSDYSMDSSIGNSKKKLQGGLPAKVSTFDIEAIKKALEISASINAKNFGISAIAKCICQLRPSSFNLDDWIVLIEGFDEGADATDKSAASRTLQKLGYHQESAKPKSERKRGPKPQATTNKTDEETRRHLTKIRGILRPQDTSDKMLPSLLVAVLSLYQVVCEGGFFLSENEQSVVKLLTTQKVNLAARLSHIFEKGHLAFGPALKAIPPSEDVAKWLQDLCESCWVKAEKYSWDQLIFEAECNVRNVEKAIAKSDLYRELLHFLGLQPQVKPTNPEKLAIATDLLYNIRRTLEHNKLCEASPGICKLYTMFRSLSIGNDLGNLPEDVYTLEGIFITAERRQGISPFPRLLQEEFTPGLDQIPEEGQTVVHPEIR